MQLVTQWLTCLKVKGLLNSAVWSGAIHYNTDNIHVHVAFVEPEPTRELMMYKGTLQRRGKLKYSNIERAKSRIANSISDRTLDFQKIDELVRQKIGSNEIAYQDLDEKKINRALHQNLFFIASRSQALEI